jgi:RNA polymerase sigma-70 factor (sigma-E family)
MIAAMGSEAVAGPGGALEGLHREQYRSLVRLASLLVDDVGRCEEIVQDAFVAVFRKPGLVREQAKLPAYLRSAVLNGARSHLRARQVRNRAQPLRVVHDAESPEAGALLADDQRAVLDALRALPDRQRDVLALRFYLDLSESEIAEVMDIAPGTVKTHVRRGLEALATTLEDRR